VGSKQEKGTHESRQKGGSFYKREKNRGRGKEDVEEDLRSSLRVESVKEKKQSYN